MMTKQIKLKKSWVVAIVALFGASLIGVGVFAATAITVNSGSAVSLGAGSAQVSTPCGVATISTQQYLNSGSGTFYTGTFSVDLGSASATCGGKTLSFAFATGSTTGNATWAIQSGQHTYSYGIGGTTGGTTNSGGTMTGFDTAGTNLATVAIAVQ
jgi:hypothetical protein